MVMYSPQTSRPQLIEGVDSPTPAPLAPSVMVIDDSQIIRMVVEASLTRHGYRVAAFSDGLAAMGALARGEVTVPNLLLLDIGLPKMDGYEVARILRSKADFDQTVLVMLTAHDGVLDKLRGRLVGASDYITKPFKVRDMVETVRSFVEGMKAAPDPVFPR